MQKLPKLRVDYSRLAVTWLRYFKRYINVHAISEWLQPCRTQVPWMGDVVVAYGPSAGLGRQKENSGFRCFDGWNWAVLSCNIEQLLLFSYEVILVALEKTSAVSTYFCQHYLLWVRICSPELVLSVYVRADYVGDVRLLQMQEICRSCMPSPRLVLG